MVCPFAGLFVLVLALIIPALDRDGLVVQRIADELLGLHVPASDCGDLGAVVEARREIHPPRPGRVPDVDLIRSVLRQTEPFSQIGAVDIARDPHRAKLGLDVEIGNIGRNNAFQRLDRCFHILARLAGGNRILQLLPHIARQEDIRCLKAASGRPVNRLGLQKARGDLFHWLLRDLGDAVDIQNGGLVAGKNKGIRDRRILEVADCPRRRLLHDRRRLAVPCFQRLEAAGAGVGKLAVHRLDSEGVAEAAMLLDEGLIRLFQCRPLGFGIGQTVPVSVKHGTQLLAKVDQPPELRLALRRRFRILDLVGKDVVQTHQPVALHLIELSVPVDHGPLRVGGVVGDEPGFLPAHDRAIAVRWNLLMQALQSVHKVGGTIHDH